jgi:hypothetical protein
VVSRREVLANMHKGAAMEIMRRPAAVRGWMCCFAAMLGVLSSSPRSAVQYPLSLTLNASLTTETTTVTSAVAVHVDRLMEESRRMRALTALNTGGYGNFLTVLRALPAIGTIEVRGRSVDVRYAYEQADGTGRRLLLIADRPLVFITGDPSKSRAGYELTLVDLRFDAEGGVAGTMAGAARVKPSPSGPVLNDFAEAPVRLAARGAK